MRNPAEFFTKSALRRRRRQQVTEAVLTFFVLLGVATLISLLIYMWGATP